MRKLLVQAFVIGPTTIFGQPPINKPTEVIAKYRERVQDDTSVITAVMVGPGRQAPKTAYFLNGRFIKISLLVSINPEFMESLKVIYKPIEIDSIQYDRQIHLLARHNYFPKAISLLQLKDKYFSGGLINDSLLFMIDGNIVHGDYHAHEIDENNLFAVTLDSQNEGDKIKLKFLKLTTRSEANIKNFKYGSIWMQVEKPIKQTHLTNGS